MNAHLRAQALRVARLFVVAFGAQLAATGTEHLGWKALASLAVGAAEAVVRQLWPTAPALPWKAVEDRLRPPPAPAPRPLDPPGT